MGMGLLHLDDRAKRRLIAVTTGLYPQDGIVRMDFRKAAASQISQVNQTRGPCALFFHPVKDRNKVRTSSAFRLEVQGQVFPAELLMALDAIVAEKHLDLSIKGFQHG